MEFLLIFAILYPVLVSIESANILTITQFPYWSHQNFHHKITEVLLEEGHNITIFTTHLHDYGDHPNITQYQFTESVSIHNKYTDMLMYKQKELHYSQIIYRETMAYYEASRKELEHPAIQNLIHNSSNYHFDLIILECFVCPFFLMAEIYDCPFAYISAIDPPNIFHSMFGNDVNPLKYSESTTLPSVHGKLTLYEKFRAVMFQYFYQEFIFNTHNSYKNVILRWEYMSHLGLKVAEAAPGDHYSLLILNTNHAVGHVRAMMPHSIQIGFFHVDEPKEIKDLELKNFLDLSESGVIIMVFGSTVNAKNLGTNLVKKFMNTFRTCNMSVLWKLEEVEDGLEVPSNVKIVSWLPLADALAHPNVKLLIFHGGLFSLYEAIDREVPMIVFPLSYDQPANARILVDKGVAMELDLNNFDEFELSSAIREMLKLKYVANVRKVRAMAYNTPISSRDLIKWHVNNAIKNRITYSKDFGSMCFFGSPLNHFLVYGAVFILLICFLIWRMLTRTQKKTVKVD